MTHKSGMLPLDPEQKAWVEKTLAGMTLERLVGQLLLPNNIEQLGLTGNLHDTIRRLQPGGLFLFRGTTEQLRERVESYRACCEIPPLIASDLECGAGSMVDDAIRFPDPLAVGAADDESLAAEMGRATALEGLRAGINWSFSPIADLNMNPANPITNTRSFGDDPARVLRVARALIGGMQSGGMAACAKHFPGDGVDWRDQHITTTVNSLSKEEWLNNHGAVFRGLYEAGVWTTMIGHIALPAFSPEKNRLGVCRPATVNPDLIRLVRRDFGFDGLIVTDDMNMGGVSGYLPRRERTPACIQAGCDMLLFPHHARDYELLLAAVKSGALTEERLYEAVRRILELKARLNLHRPARDAAWTAADRAHYESAARQLAESALVQVRDADGLIPLRGLKAGARVLTVTVGSPGVDVPCVDEALRSRGFQVEHLCNPELIPFVETAVKYAAVFVNFCYRPDWCTQLIQPVGPQNRIFWNSFIPEHPCAVFTSFASPYHLQLFDALPNLLNAHSTSPDSQRAAVKVWFGELKAAAQSPVKNLTR